jgi:hypothetical protein
VKVLEGFQEIRGGGKSGGNGDDGEGDWLHGAASEARRKKERKNLMRKSYNNGFWAFLMDLSDGLGFWAS